MMAVATMTAGFPHVARGAPAALDSGVITRCRAQDPMAFRAFVVRYERMVFALLSRMLGHGPEVEDLAQETFVRAYRAFPSFDPNGPAKVSTWLLTIATRLALDSRKRRKLGTQSIDDDAESIASRSTPERDLERRELGAAIERAASTLPEDQCAALILAEMHGLSIAEIAGALEVPENTVKTRLFRAREKMRAALSTDWRPS
jgi:RNA polymerase sigma-70 factor, ECF subfamily